MIVSFCLNACGIQKNGGRKVVYIPMIEYSQNKRNMLANALERCNCDIIYQFIGDYKNLRDKVKENNKNI